MATYDMRDTPSLGAWLQFRLARAATKPRKVKEATTRTQMYSVIRLLMHLAGFSCFTYAAWTIIMPAGLIVAGLSFLVLSWLALPDQK